jgi:hypothetical protein
MIIEPGPGKQVVVTSDPRISDIWLQICANGGSLGVALPPEQAMEIGLALFQMGRRAKRSLAPIDARQGTDPKGLDGEAAKAG